ncbi:MAG TPA: hypothetical protein VFB13_04525 [Reyranella sp.]|jgi:hypothetical protein|nr:hypothetical protein [Reyranella sp.]
MTAMPPQHVQHVAPAEQARGLRILSWAMVAAGLIAGVGLPAVFAALKIEVSETSSGFDLVWLFFLAMMAVDFALAWWMARRAAAIERTIPPV